MRILVIGFCILMLAGCGLVKRVIPGRPSPRIIVAEAELQILPETALAFAPAGGKTSP